MDSHNKPTFFIKTLGCKVNQYESERIREALIDCGFMEGSPGSAGVYIVNSCTVTHKADRDTRRIVRRFHGMNPHAKIIVAGCYAEMEEDRRQLSGMDGVTHLLKNRDKSGTADLLRREFGMKEQNIVSHISSFKEHDRAFVKIQDGCNNQCSYCKISIVRGRSCSRKREDILAEVKGLLSNGYKEIVLTGICLGAWGEDFKKRMSLSGLLRQICILNGNFRVRLSSVEPMHITDDLLETIAQFPKICRHIHMPLQSGDDKILELMGRGYTGRQFLGILERIENSIPGFSFTTDIIVGFPGEDETCFRHTCELLMRANPSRVHIFSYSKRERTPAYFFAGACNARVIKSRVKILENIAASLALSFRRKSQDMVVPVLVESKRDKMSGKLKGYTDTYITVLFDGSDQLRGNIIPVRIEEVSVKGVYGVPAVG